jgi:hypothetical protein
VETAAGGVGGAAERGGDLAVGEIAGVAQGDGRPLLWRQGSDGRPDPLVGLGVGDSELFHLGDRNRPAPAGAVVVDRLAVGNRKQPAAQIAGVFQLRIGAQGGDEGLLETVVGIGASDCATQHAHHVGGVLVEKGLEGRQLGHSWIKRFTSDGCERATDAPPHEAVAQQIVCGDSERGP